MLAVLGGYSATAGRLPDLPEWGDALVLSCAVLPLTFALVLLALPLRPAVSPVRLALAAAALAGAAAVADLAGLAFAASILKLAAATLAAWCLLSLLESLAWVLLVAVVIAPIDIASVARGPTREIIDEQPGVFEAVSVALPVPGEDAFANLGLPDVLFFALFLGAADRFALRVGWTWVAMVASFGLTGALAFAFESEGLPALPLLSAAFVAANADLLWRQLRPHPARARERRA